MIPEQITFWVEKRKSFGKDEWALHAQFADHPHWTLKTWPKEPTKKQKDQAIKLIMRSFEFYHRHLHIPSFRLKDVSGGSE